ncbi:MarR family transcriptional regulator [Halobacteria archaeon AArc-curdl1]|uniref:MarR family transcriptional regulator n=1 Tax=Natronosalvus hydrolyticus TaxID=2979988 RepID=A0AAP2ZB59_9EURY|nr:MarR family transcriptional regulator [Halobacteria archaeon AArc-curdl1]
MNDVLEEVEFLTRSPHRVEILTALAEEPRDRSTLKLQTGASASTISRTLRAFEDRHWVERIGHHYEATELGSFVADTIRETLGRLETEQKLRSEWRSLPDDAISLEAVVDATITCATVDDPYRPISRFATLLEESTTLRFVGFELGLVEPCIEELCGRIIDGMDTTIIDQPAVARYIRSTYPVLSRRTLESGNLIVYLQEELPQCGLSLFDQRVALCFYVPDTGTVRTLLDTDDSAVYQWAEATYESVRNSAQPVTFEDGELRPLEAAAGEVPTWSPPPPW